METEMIAYCGLMCHDCPVVKAYETGDAAAKRAVADGWSKGYATLFPDGLSAEDVRCAGCKGDEALLFVYCRECRIRPCARERGHDTCAECDEYESCELLAGFFEAAPEPRAVLEAIRRGEPYEGIDTFK